MVAKISPSPSDNFFYRCFSLLTFFTLCVLIPSRRSLWIPLVTFKRAETSKQIRNKDQGHNLFDTDQHRLLITNFIDFLGDFVWIVKGICSSNWTANMMQTTKSIYQSRTLFWMRTWLFLEVVVFLGKRLNKKKKVTGWETRNSLKFAHKNNDNDSSSFPVWLSNSIIKTTD